MNTLVTQITAWCELYEIRKFHINDDFSIDVESDVYLTDKNLENLPFKFNFVKGNFFCDRNRLKDLHNMPNYVEGSLNLSYNLITNLACQKMKIKENIFLFDNPIETFDGFEADFIKIIVRFPKDHSCLEYPHLQKNNRMTMTMKDLEALFLKEKLQQNLEIKEKQLRNKI